MTCQVIADTRIVSVDNSCVKHYILALMGNNVEHRRLRRPPGSTPLPNNGWRMNASAYFEWVERVKKDQIGFDPTLGKNGVILSEGIKHPNSGSGLSDRADSLYEG